MKTPCPFVFLTAFFAHFSLFFWNSFQLLLHSAQHACDFDILCLCFQQLDDNHAGPGHIIIDYFAKADIWIIALRVWIGNESFSKRICISLHNVFTGGFLFAVSRETLLCFFFTVRNETRKKKKKRKTA